MAELHQIRKAQVLKQAIIAALVSLGAFNVAVTALTLASL